MGETSCVSILVTNLKETIVVLFCSRENNCWEKYYAQLTPLALKIYADKPNSNSVSINQLDLVSTDTYGKVTMEPLPSEIGVPVANSDLPFILKIEVSPNSMCWPPKCIIFMALCAEDKEKWYNGLLIKRY